jgi:hypothetical protein
MTSTGITKLQKPLLTGSVCTSEMLAAIGATARNGFGMDTRNALQAIIGEVTEQRYHPKKAF